MGFFDFLKKDMEESPESVEELDALEKDARKERIIRLLDGFNYHDLRLSHLQSEAETLFAYLNYLSNAVSAYIGSHDYSRIDARLKAIHEHSKNMIKLVDILILNYYNPLIDTLTDINDIEFIREIDNIIVNLGKEKKQLNELIESISKMGSIGEQNITASINTGEVGRLIENAALQLNKKIIGRDSIRAKIRREDPIEVVRGIIVGKKD